MHPAAGKAGLLALLALGPASCGGGRDGGEATVLYFTDAHEIAPVVDRHGDRGGVARLKTAVERARRRDPSALVVFGGDLAGGTLFGGVFRGEPMVDALSRAGVGLAAFGQHDFDFGAAHARALAARSAFPWITSNLVDAAGAPFGGLPTRLLRRVGGLRVGFLALTDDMSTTTQEGAVFQTDLVAAARAGADALGREGAEAVVALTQTGAATNERILREVPLVDAILTEEESEERAVVRFTGSRPSAAGCGNIGCLVELRLAAGPGGRARPAVLVHPVDPTVPPDPGLLAEERRWMARLEAMLAGPAGALAAPLPAAGSRAAETALGDLVADAFREAAGADAALVAGSSLRADLPAGALTRRHIVAVLPFSNRVTLLALPGSALREALEAGLSGGHGTTSLLQVSGLSYTGDPAAPPGRRLADVRIGGAPLRDDVAYRVAVSSYLAGGGEGLAFLAKAPRLPIPGGEPLDADALAARLVRLGAGSPIRSPAGGRITLREGSLPPDGDSPADRARARMRTMPGVRETR